MECIVLCDLYYQIRVYLCRCLFMVVVYIHDGIHSWFCGHVGVYSRWCIIVIIHIHGGVFLWWTVYVWAGEYSLWCICTYSWALFTNFHDE